MHARTQFVKTLEYDMYWHFVRMFSEDNFARNPSNVYGNEQLLYASADPSRTQLLAGPWIGPLLARHACRPYDWCTLVAGSISALHQPVSSAGTCCVCRMSKDRRSRASSPSLCRNRSWEVLDGPMVGSLVDTWHFSQVA